MEIREVIAAGPGWTRVRADDGNTYTFRGNRNWRNNNPGNIRASDYAKRHGAIGDDGEFAVFPSYEAGRAAKSSLLFSSPSYADRTLSDAISRYAPPNENNTKGYYRRVARDVGVPIDTPLSSLTDAQREAMLDSMQRVEGFRVGKAFDAQGNIVDPSALQENQTTGIMQVINNAPTPEPRPEQGLLAAYAQPSGSIERRDLPPVNSGLLSQSTPTAASAFADPRGPNWENPFAAVTPQQETTPSMSIADQYASYGAGKAAPVQAGLLSQDVAYQRMIDGLNAQKQQPGAINVSAQAQPQTAAERMGLQNPAPWNAQPVTTQPAPQEVAQVEAPEAVPQFSVQPQDTQAAQAAPALNAGLLSPQAQPRDLAADQALADRVRFGLGAQKALGAVGGGLLGGIVLGPLGALAGGLLGKNIGARTYYPPAPKPAQGKSSNNGGKRLTRDTLSREGRDMYNQSEQVRNVVDNDLPGLW